MADQIEIRIPKTQYNEGTAFTAQAFFRTRASASASAPTTVRYRIDDLESRQAIREWTNVPQGQQDDVPLNITIRASDNAIQNDNKAFETRQLTVQAEHGTDSQITQAVQWKVRNLYGIT